MGEALSSFREHFACLRCFADAFSCFVDMRYVRNALPIAVASIESYVKGSPNPETISRALDAMLALPRAK